MEASQVVGHKGFFECQTLSCFDLGTERLFQHGAAMQEYSQTQPQCLVSLVELLEVVKPLLHPTRSLSGMCWLLLHPRSTGTLFLGSCRRRLAALVAPAGGHQLLLPALRLLSPSQHWPSKLLCVSQCLPLGISRCCSPVGLETAPFLPLTVCWVGHLCWLVPVVRKS